MPPIKGSLWMDLKRYLKEKRMLVDKALAEYLPEVAGPTSRLVQAMRYSVFAGGKRLRPILCMAGAEAVGSSGEGVLPAACALELIHTYSLIHDDLPAMDDDDLRRGKPTNHKVFGDGIALLAGDGLLTEAFVLVSSEELVKRFPASVLLKVIHRIAAAAGHRGMVGGQTADILSEGMEVDLAAVEFIHTRKTGALITAAVVSGGLLGGGTDEQIDALAQYGQNVGFAFQIADDILDLVGDSRVMGKRAGGDDRRKKATYPGTTGLSRAREAEIHLVRVALDALAGFDHAADPLRAIALYIVEREK